MRAVAHDHHFLKYLVVLFKDDGEGPAATDLHGLVNVANVRDGQLVALVGFEREVTVEVSNRSVSCARHDDACTDDGLSA